MNTLTVFAVAATATITLIVGWLLGMYWVEQRMLGTPARRDPAPSSAAADDALGDADRVPPRTHSVPCRHHSGLPARMSPRTWEAATSVIPAWWRWRARRIPSARIPHARPR